MNQQSYINSVNLREGTDFPYLVLNVIDGNSYPRNPGFQVMHWHEDLQFIYVLSGGIEVVTLEGSVSPRSGEGVLIKKMLCIRRGGMVRADTGASRFRAAS